MEPRDASSRETTVDVSIGGQPYRLRGHEPETLRRLAAEVDTALAEVAPHAVQVDDIKVAVLAALNIAGDRAAERQALSRRMVAAFERLRILEGRLESLRRTVAADESGTDRSG